MKRIAYVSGYKYQLKEPYEDRVPFFPESYVDNEYVKLSQSGDLVILKGYAWNGASGPTIDTKSSMRASLVHDALYQLIRLGQLKPEDKKKADELFLALCLEDGMFPIRAKLWFLGVKDFGKSSTLPENEPVVEFAP